MKELKLLPHQESAIEHLSYDEFGRDLVHIPTGGGKTIIIIKLCYDYVKRGKRCLILVHRDHLVQQVIERFGEYWNDLDIGIVKGKSRQWDHDIVVATIQTASNDIATMPTDFDLVITDECHNSMVSRYFSVYRLLDLINMSVFSELVEQAGIEAVRSNEADALRSNAASDLESKGIKEGKGMYEFMMERIENEARQLTSKNKMSKAQRDAITKLSDKIEPIDPVKKERKHVGFTATPRRTDKLGLASVFTGIAYHCEMKELVEAKRLCRVDIMPIALYDDKGIQLRYTELRKLLRSGDVDEKIVDIWHKNSTIEDSTIAFCMSIEHAEQLAESFRKKGISAEAIHSKLEKDVREEREEAFRTKELTVLTNVNIFIEGLDVPNLNRVIMARDTESATLAAQAIGRGARISEGKEACLVFDMGETIDRNVLSDSVDMLRVIEYGEGEGDGKKRKKKDSEKQKPAPVTPTLGAARIQRIFKFMDRLESQGESWTWLPEIAIKGLFLEIGGGRRLRIGQQEDELFAASYDTGEGRRLVCRDKATISECKDICIRYILDNKLTTGIYGRKDAKWRLKGVSAGQKRWLTQRGIALESDWTRGTVSDLISTYIQNYGKKVNIN